MKTLIASALAATLLAGLPANAATIQDGSMRFNVDTITDDLENPWGMAFLPGGAILVSERAGRLRLVENGKLSAPLAGVPKVVDAGQGGLLDVALDPDFGQNGLVYLSYSEAGSGGAGTAVGRGVLKLDGGKPRLEGFKRIYAVKKKSSGGRHFGSRLVFGRDKTLFVTLGDRGDDDRAQDPFDAAGSVIRINRDGTIPPDNPFADGKKAAPEIWSTGHRNAQGAALDPRSGQLWTVEHGARGGDEINRPEAGKNYGWPVISYGRQYSGFKIGIGTQAPGMEQPVHYWDPSIAPSGMTIYSGERFPAWKGDILVGALKFQMLVRLDMENGKVVGEERFFARRFGRIRDVRQGPEGNLWLLTDSGNGKLIRIAPAE